MKPTFTESQKFTQWWVWLILLVIMSGILIGSYIDYNSFSELDITNNHDPIIPTILILLMIVLFLVLKLTTEIDQIGIKMNLFPFVKKRADWEDIDTAEVINYGFVGGWGIRLWTKYGTVYNIKGKMGLAITLKNGDKFLIGTQKEEELRLIIDQYQNTTKI